MTDTWITYQQAIERSGRNRKTIREQVLKLGIETRWVLGEGVGHRQKEMREKDYRRILANIRVRRGDRVVGRMR